MKVNRILYWSAAAVTLVSFVVLYSLAPLYADDLWYASSSALATSRWQASLEVWRVVIDHWFWDTGRLTQFFAPPFLTFAHGFVFALVTSALIGCIIRVGRISAGFRIGSLFASLYLLIVVAVLPWHDNMLSVVYAINYVWTTAFVMVALWACVRSGDDFSGWRKAGLIIVCLLAGWMHEGFSVPLLAGFCAWMAVKRVWRPNVYMLSFALGAIFIALSPALRVRSASHTGFLCHFLGWEALTVTLVYDCLYFIFVALIIGCLMHRYWRKMLSADRNSLAPVALCFISATCSTLLFLMFYDGPRMGWFSQLMSGLGILLLVKTIKPKWSLRTSTTVSALTLLFVALHFATAIISQVKLTREYNEVVRLYRASTDGMVYYDQQPFKYDLALMLPSYRQLLAKAHIDCFSRYYSPGKRDMVILPTSFAELNDENLVAAPSDDTMLIYRNRYLIMRPGVTQPARVLLDGRIKSRVEPIGFVNRAGEEFVWLKLVANKLYPELTFHDAETDK